jgi:hypothetical protein
MFQLKNLLDPFLEIRPIAFRSLLLQTVDKLLYFFVAQGSVREHYSGEEALGSNVYELSIFDYTWLEQLLILNRNIAMASRSGKHAVGYIFNML